MSAVIRSERDGAVVLLTISYPAKKNALGAGAYVTLAEALRSASADETVRSIVVSGDGGNFCSGNDVGEFPVADTGAGPNPVMDFLHALIACEKPLVAGVEGVAAGIGATMLLHFDSVVVARNASVLFPFVNLALPPEGGSSLLLPRMLGYTRAAELLLRGKPIDGSRAWELGIASTLAEPGSALATARERAAEFAAKPPRALRLSRQLLRGDTGELLARLEQEKDVLFDCMRSDEHREALAALLSRKARAS